MSFWQRYFCDRNLLLALTLLGLFVRSYEACRNALNPDEVWIAFIARPESWFSESLAQHHPPFFYLFQHWVQKFSQTEWALRLVPVVAGTFYPLVVALWLNRTGMRAAGFFAFALLEFSPNLMALSMEGRGYTLCLLLLSGALYWLERSLQSGKTLQLGFFAILLYLAILTEYMAIFAAAGMGVYGLLRLGSQPRSFQSVWLLLQIGGVLIYWWLYQATVRTLLDRDDVNYYVTGYLKNQFPQEGQNLVYFAVKNTARVFSMLGYKHWIGFVLMAAAAASILRRESRAFLFAVLVSMGLAIGFAIGTMHPYGSTRHSTAIALFLAALAGMTVDWLASRYQWFRPRMAALVLAVVMLAYYPELRYIEKDFLARSLEGAVRAIPPEVKAVLVEEETAFLLRYYLAGKGAPTEEKVKLQKFQMAGGRQFAWYRWAHKSEGTIREDSERMRVDFGWTTEEPIWVLDSGFRVSSDSLRLAQKKSGVVLGFAAPKDNS